MLIVSCDSPTRNSEGKTNTTTSLHSMNRDLTDLKGWRYVFVSRRGVSYGMDSDSSIEFRSNGRARLTEAGYVVNTYEGVYSMNENGVISVNLARYKSQWPKMVLRRDGQDFLLFREDAHNSFEMGERGAATEIPEMNPFWPFALTQSEWSPQSVPEEACPCCYYISLNERGYSEVCKVCFWKDYNQYGGESDNEPLDTPTNRNGGLSLKQARQNYIEYGACDSSMKRFVAISEELEGFQRANE